MNNSNGKSDYARNIELFDVKNLTPENIEYMMQVIRKYFTSTFPVKPELLNEILGHTKIVDDETFKKALEESGRVVEDVDLKYGFYDKKSNIGYINQDRHHTAGELFVTLFHESLHAVSYAAGAGFRGEFALPVSYDDLEQRVAMERGLIALIEGTTHYITLKNVIGNMGFEGTENMFRYKAERSIMSRIWEAFPEDAMYRAYFVVPIEELRRYFDMTVASDDKREEIKADASKTSGQFAKFLVDIGLATDRAKKLLESGIEDEEASTKIYNDIMRAVEYFLACQKKMAGQ
ncbi:hypothetical protein IKG13_01245 [Candidatus Saccharibacteria bacterium]|nr:hypothetical protein [Candidatus Saccharibacteria bacterium]MBR3378353.1 hypothetical protein [Candidatus Saccharibacteria bacterium]